MKGRSLELLLFLTVGCGGAATEDSTGRGGPSASAATQGAWFEEVALASGIDFTHVRANEQRLWFPEIVGAGAGFFDYDGDGDLDAYLLQSGDLHDGPGEFGNQLFANNGDGTFEDVTESAGVGDTGYGMGCAAADYDADGDIDLYVTNYGPDVFYRNAGDGTFVDATAEVGLGNRGWGLSAAFIDYDADKDLDLFVVNYINWSSDREIECKTNYSERTYCHPRNYNAPAHDVLYRNDGDGTYTEVTRSVGLQKTFGNGMGIACGDFDRDGRMDIFVTNDGMANQLWLNKGGGKLEDKALLAGCAVNSQGTAEASMGVAAADIDQDGDPDLFMTHLREETNTVYLNKNGVFTDRTAQSGLAKPSITYTGFGMGFADFDCDGTLDVYVANGRVGSWLPILDDNDEFAEPNQLFKGMGGGKFEEVTPREELTAEWLGTSRGAAFGDYDNDGDIDILVSDNHGRARLLRNLAERTGNHWIRFSVIDRSGRDAIGAEVSIEVGDRTQRRVVETAYSFCATNDPRVHFGLGAETEVSSVAVRWPDGSRTTHGPFAADTEFVLEAGEE